jgi:hypothetical protein
MSDQSAIRPFVFTVIEDDGENVIIEVSEEDYRLDLEAGVSEEETLKPGRYKFKRGGFLARHPELKNAMRTQGLIQHDETSKIRLSRAAHRR